MVDRLLLWLGAGVIAGGVTVGMLAGAGTADAQTESDGDGGAKSSQSAKPADNEQDSSRTDTSEAPGAKPRFGRDAVKAINAVKGAVNDAVTKVVKAAGDSERATVAESNVRTTVRPEQGQRAAKLVNNVIAAVTHQPDRKVVIDRTRQTDPVEKVDTVDAVETESTNVATLERRQGEVVRTNFVNQLATFAPKRSNLTPATPTLAQPQVAAAVSPKIDVPPVVSAIGTAVFGLISFAEGVIEGPLKALPGSGVTVKRSTLKIGEQEVPADWYFPAGYDPDSEAPPERIIYLQHGFGARGVFYDYTASYLAKSTNSIVVAPTLTSNLFATDGMWLGGDPMHREVANLFNDANDELLKSATAAGYKQDQLPQQVVLVGHSLGGGLVLNTARYMVKNQETRDSTYYKLAGVLMLDGVSFTDPALHLAEIPDGPDGIPVYNLSATPYPWNLFGTMDAALAQERPTEFHGAQMLFGLHSDAMVGGNPLIALAAYLVTGYGGPANVQGSQVLAASWINDMFAGERTCTDASSFCGATGSSFTIPTSFGPAIGLVAPKADPINSILSELTLAFFRLSSIINFATDVDTTQTQAVTMAPAIAA